MKHKVTAAAALVVLLVGSIPTIDPPAPPMLPRQTTADGAWLGTFTAQAVRHQDAIFHSFAASNGVWVAAARDDGTLDKIKLLPTVGMDDHHAAALAVRPDGKILAAYSKHNDTILRTRLLTNPQDLRSWSTVRTAATGSVTYPQLIHLSAENRWFLFYRQGTSSDGPLEMVTSTDGGHTWSAQKRVTVKNGRSHYTAIATNGTDTIDLMIADGHPRIGGTPPASLAVPGRAVVHLNRRFKPAAVQLAITLKDL